MTCQCYPANERCPCSARCDTILERAARAVDERGQDYGHPAVNHDRTARLWNAYLTGRPDTAAPLSAEDVCVLNILQKLARSQHRMTDDTLVDIAGFARNIELIRNA